MNTIFTDSNQIHFIQILLGNKHMDCSGILEVNGIRSTVCIHPVGDVISDSIRRAHSWDTHMCMNAAQLAKGGTVWDIGANIGAISLCMLLMSSQVSVTSIEAAPWNFRLLNATRMHQDNVNRDWEIYHAALDESNGQSIKFIGTKNNDCGTTTVNPKYHPHKNRGCGKDPSKKTTMMATTLDTLMQDKCANVVKIDVEGFEGFLLKGFSKHLNDVKLRPCHIVMEWHIILLNAAGAARSISDNAVAVSTFLHDAGYATSSDVTMSHESVVWSRNSSDIRCCEYK